MLLHERRDQHQAFLKSCRRHLAPPSPQMRLPQRPKAHREIGQESESVSATVGLHCFMTFYPSTFAA